MIEKLRMLRPSKAAELVESGVEEMEEHWRRNRTNPLERILRVSSAARLRYIAGTAWSTKRYLNIELMRDQQMSFHHHRLSQRRALLNPKQKC